MKADRKDSTPIAEPSSSARRACDEDDCRQTHGSIRPRTLEFERERNAMNVGFVGLGTMGLAMAANILRGGHRVRGYDRSGSAVQAHVGHGGLGTTSVAEACNGAEMLITMLPDGKTVRNALFEADALTGLVPGALVIDMSTSHPLDTDSLRADVEALGFRFIDAPVGRTPAEAITGDLLILAGGKAADIERARAVFECMGESVIDCGGPGKGARMKIVNNTMTTVLNVLTAEAVALAEAIGLDRDLTVETLRGTAAGKGLMHSNFYKKAFQGDFSPAFMVDLARKDLGIALDLAGRNGLPMAVAQGADKVYERAQQDRLGQMDWTVVYRMLRECRHDRRPAD
ncbi:MAG: NAD(P)-binding domain-containing protein [Burkholderiaceae bacterium]